MALIRQTGVFTDRFGNTVDLDNIPAAVTTAATAYIGSADQFVEIDDTRFLSASGIVYIIGRTLRITSNGALRQNSNGQTDAGLGGKHIYFINCDFEFENVTAQGVLGPDVNGTNARAFTGRVSDGQASSTSVNVVGCDVYFANAAGTIQTVVTDVIDSNFRVSNEVAGNYVLNRNPGSQTNNALLEGRRNGSIYEWNFYGNPQDLSNFVIDGFRLKTGSGVSGTDGFVYAPSAQFSNTNPLWFYAFGGDQSNNGFTHTGFTYIAPTASSAALTDKFSTPNGNTVVVNSYGYNPTVYSDGLLSETVQGCRYRFRTNAGITTRSGTNTAGAVSSSARAQDITNELVTNAAGKLASSRRSVDSQGSFQPGYFDYGQFELNDTVGATSILSTQTGQTSEAGLVSLPIQVFKSTSGFTPTNRLQGRSYANELDYNDTPNESDYTVNEYVPIDAPNVVAPSLIGVRIKSTNVDSATNLPDISFTGGSTETVSLQDFANIARAVWYEYGFDPDEYYGTGGSNLPAAGPFDETDWGLRPVISKSNPSGDSHATVIASGTGWSVRNHDNEGQLRISVWAPGGLAADTTNDIVGNDPTRINSHNNGSTPLVGTALEVPGGAINFQRIENSTIRVEGGEIEIDPQRTSSSDTFLRGTVSLEHTLWANAGTAANSGGWITNIPRIAGRDTLEDNWTIVSGKLRTDDQSGGGSGSENDPGIWDNSEWNNGTTTNQVRINKLTGNFTINAGSHAFQLETAPASDLTWTFRNVEDGNLNIDLPTTAATGLVRFDTGVDAQNTDLEQYNVVRAWLLAELGGADLDNINNVNQERTAAAGGTEPTTGYWLVRPPAMPATPVVLKPFGVIENDNTSADWTGSINQQGGVFAYKVVGAALNTAVIHNISAATTLADISIPDTNDEQNVNYFYYYKPANVLGANRVSYRPVTGIWNPSVNGNFDIGTILDPALLVSAGTSTITSFTTSYASNVLTVLLTGFTSTDTPSAGDSVSLALALGDDSDVINAILDGEIAYSATNRLWDFGNESSVTYNVGTGNVMRIQTGDANQQQLPNASGFATNTAAVSVPTVGDPQVNQLLGTDQQIEEIAGGTGAITELGNELKANQSKLATDVRRASLLQPGSGTIPNTAD